jgi:hypothetical protein
VHWFAFPINASWVQLFPSSQEPGQEEGGSQVSPDSITLLPQAGAVVELQGPAGVEASAVETIMARQSDHPALLTPTRCWATKGEASMISPSPPHLPAAFVSTHSAGPLSTTSTITHLPLASSLSLVLQPKE